jgi:putative aminopeptidase FrvX
MNNKTEHLISMLGVSGLSGFEDPIRQLIEKTWQPLTDEISVSNLGSLHALRKGSGAEPRKSILVATHMDAIGLIVTDIKDGLMHVTEIGGIDARVLPGQLVMVHSTEELPGVVVQPPAHTLPETAQSGPVPLKHLLVDTGLTPAQVNDKVKIGDLVSFNSEPVEMEGSYIAGHSLDNRASVAVLTECLKVLQKRKHSWDVWAVATAQEEETLGGAQTSGFAIQPTLGVVIDVTFARGPGTADHQAFEMDKGPTLDWGPNTHPKLYKQFVDLAKEIEVPMQQTAYPRMSGTDAITLQIAGNGIPTMLLGIPLRYMHTPVEMVQFKDIQRAGRLLAEFITNLDDDFMQRIDLQTDNEQKEEQS